MENQSYYKFQLAFRGQLVENSVDAFDVANTILATSQVLHELADIRYGENAKEQLQININAFKQGSLLTDFLILAKDLSAVSSPLIPVATEIYKVGSNIIKGYKSLIEIRKLLKGKAPKSVIPTNNTELILTAKDNSTININYYDFRALQSKTIGKNLSKISQPLSKESSLLEQIAIITDNKEDSFAIKKEDTKYLTPLEEAQTLPEVKYKGIVSKIDTKARSGYLDLSNKRLPFTYSAGLLDEQFIMLVESLKRKIQIYLIGSVIMDYENNPVMMEINKIESDIRLM